MFPGVEPPVQFRLVPEGMVYAPVTVALLLNFTPLTPTPPLPNSALET